MGTTYGSDVVTELLAQLGIRHVTLNPGASTRGLQDSLVRSPDHEVLLAHQENTAVAIAHGYAKATGKPMATLLHDLVGLQSGSMGVFNAFIDAVPMLVLGGSGPADDTLRRVWIDWIHSARAQGLVVRDWVKWDDQPASAAALPGSLHRAWRIATAAPQGPVYVAIDAALQEQEVERPVFPDFGPPPTTVTAPARDVEALVARLAEARAPVVLADHAGRTRQGYEQLVALAEALAVPVVDLGGRHNFPNTHWADGTSRRERLVSEADLVVALDVRDLDWALRGPTRRGPQAALDVGATVVSVGLHALRHRGFLDLEPLTPTASTLTADVGELLASAVEALPRSLPGHVDERRRALRAQPPPAPLEGAAAGPADATLTVERLCGALWEHVAAGPWQLAHGSFKGAVRRVWRFEDHNQFLGTSGGEGLGYGLGASIGAALAHRDDDTLVVDLQSDGDFLYTPTALWTAVHHRVPLLTVMVNNRSYARDRAHQATVAKDRGLSLDHIAVGIDMDDPPVDFAALARGQGVEAWGPVHTVGELAAAAREAVRVVREEGRPALIDAVVDPPSDSGSTGKLRDPGRTP